MKKFLLGLLMVGLLCLPSFAAVTEGGNVIQMTAADDTTTTVVTIRAILWVSDQNSGKDIAADDDMLLEDAAGVAIVGKRAEAAGDGLEISFPGNGITVSGLKAEDLDGGYLYIIVDKR